MVGLPAVKPIGCTRFACSLIGWPFCLLLGYVTALPDYYLACKSGWHLACQPVNYLACTMLGLLTDRLAVLPIDWLCNRFARLLPGLQIGLALGLPTCRLFGMYHALLAY